MGIWEINSSPLLDVSNPTYKANAKGVASEYSKILAEKIANVKADLEQMEEVQEQLDEIDELQEELTGNASTQMVVVETIKRFMPDGSIMVTTYEDGKVTEQVRHKPPMMVVPDYTKPPTPDGSPATELKPYQNFDLMMLLSM